MIKLRKSTIRLLALALFYLLYLVIGASVFSAIEGPQERELIKNVKKLRSDFLTDNTCLTGIMPLFNLLSKSRHLLISRSFTFIKLLYYVPIMISGFDILTFL